MNRITNIDINYTKATIDILKKKYNNDLKTVGICNIVYDYLKSSLNDYDVVDKQIEISLENGLNSSIKTLKCLKTKKINSELNENIDYIIEIINELRSDN